MSEQEQYQPIPEAEAEKPQVQTETDPAQKSNSGRTELYKSITLYIHDLIYMLCTVLVIFMLVFRIIVVSGPSMKQTLLDGDYLLLLSDTIYRNPQHGDIVVVSKQSFDNGKPIVKRVIATEGQIVDIDYNLGIVYVDGLPLEEEYTNTPTNLDEGMTFPLIVEDGCVFVMGDNRNNSRDSRSPQIGQVDRRELLGKVILLMVPGTDGKQQKMDWSRIGGVK